MDTLKQLANPDDYHACDWDFRTDAAGRATCIQSFRTHLDEKLRHVREQYPQAAEEALEAFRADFHAVLDRYAAAGPELPRVDVMAIVHERQTLLRAHGFADPYKDLKARENVAALSVLPELLAELDAVPPAAQPDLLARGLMAGNMFDLGAKLTIERYHQNTHDFWRSRLELPPRPWFLDHVDEWGRRWRTHPPYRHAFFFVDNAGWDICLGCLPLAHWMIRHGTRVTLGANTAAVLNDVTADELGEVLVGARIDVEFKDAIQNGALRLIATGSDSPLLDVTQLSEDCVAAAADCDLIMIHGMGRALESNRSARFSCDVLRTAVVKSRMIAARLGAQIFGCIFQFTPANQHV